MKLKKCPDILRLWRAKRFYVHIVNFSQSVGAMGSNYGLHQPTIHQLDSFCDSSFSMLLEEKSSQDFLTIFHLVLFSIPISISLADHDGTFKINWNTLEHNLKTQAIKFHYHHPSIYKKTTASQMQKLLCPTQQTTHILQPELKLYR